MKIAPYLQPGDQIALVAPARKIIHDEIAVAIRKMESAGYRVVYEEDLFAEFHQFAGEDPIRVATFQRYLDDPAIRMIWCVRGGYGSVRIIDQLDFTAFQKSPKWIAGFSDITVFHSHIHQLSGIPTLHCAMPVNILADDDDPGFLSLLKIIRGEAMTYRIDSHSLNRTGVAHGKLVGGNLSILYSLMGSPSSLDTAGKILFIEDLDEYLYHIDRMMMQLKRAGKLDSLAGLIVGGMSEMNDNSIPFGFEAEQIIRAHCERYSFPVCFGFPAGHIPDNRALKLGVDVELKIDNEGVTLKEISN
ncbi:MAG TPA: LD-carboxypeptidase [Bacteroidales bacterium]|nr:LD-carboxypeptidase [Bacteroidales bacterium]HQB75948.1 LD-carboxypeptidase [Bacteroidales bacterium]